MGLFESGRSAGTLFVALSFQIIRFYGAMGLIVTVGLPVVVLGFLVWVLSSAQIMFLDDGTFLANRLRVQGAVHVVLGGYMGLFHLGQSAGTFFVVLSFQFIVLYGAMGRIVTVGLPVVVLVFLVKVLFSALIRILGDDTFLANRFREQGAVHVVLGSYMGLWLCLLLEPHVGALPHRRHWGRR